MAKSRNFFIKPAWSVFIRWILLAIVLSLGIMVVGCVAQQADVVRIKRELDAKINQLDKSKTSLQQAVADANSAREKANALIAQQRAEIQELLHARAEVMDQVATLKDTDLSQVRGDIEKNQHFMEELDEKFLLLDEKIQTIETKAQESQRVMEPLVQELRTQLTAEEQLRAEQGGKLGEFRTAMVDYQQVLTTLRQNVAKQEQQVEALRQQVDQLGYQQDSQYHQVQADVKDVRQHIKSVIGTLDQISTTFSGRLDAYEQQQSRATQQTRSSDSKTTQTALVSSPSNPITANSNQVLMSTNSLPSSGASKKVSATFTPSSNNVIGESTMSYAGQGEPRLTPSISIQKNTQDEREVYQQAFSLLRGKNYHRAAKEFSGFLRAFPDSPLAANSQYWLGECFYGQRRFQEAIDEFERVFTFYPSSNKVPASLLKIGYSHLELQQPSMARSVFQQLVRTHPQSSEAIKAHGRLQEVNSKLHNPS